ncbi:hypothetical protein [Nocardia farcinica]|uniref:hypothetical protein n=1 Tax=Nocardia farcinica TaxID=37329 RepID=UPI0018962645|nr:hypothetical protein [Nocardia farcinica]MBF6071702.1 hypothetical protein [Nocardia farcinica]MBF6535979.1 hypothetical protein [Nocardia farcinica]
MTEQLKFFSQEWLDAAIVAVNDNPEVRQGFKNPDTFTNKMEFGTLDRGGVVSHLEWDRGRVVSWTTRTFEEAELWLIINGSLQTWQDAASGAELGGKLLLAGKIKFAKGPMTAAIENAGALNAFLATWGQVPTDWNV